MMRSEPRLLSAGKCVGTFPWWRHLIPNEINQRNVSQMYNKENLAKLKKMDSLAPQVMKAFWAFDKAAVADGDIPVKYKELIAVAVALTTQCPYCIDIHS